MSAEDDFGAKLEKEINGVSRRRTRMMRTVVLLMWLTVAFLLALAVIFGVFQARSTQPVKVYSSRLQTKVACPYGDVFVKSTYEILEGYSIYEVRYASTWTELGQPTNQQPGGEISYAGRDLPPIRGEKLPDTTTPFTRKAPITDEETMWLLTTTVSVSYGVYGIPHLPVTYTYRSRGALEVLPLTDPKCIEKASKKHG